MTTPRKVLRPLSLRDLPPRGDPHDKWNLYVTDLSGDQKAADRLIAEVGGLDAGTFEAFLGRLVPLLKRKGFSVLPTKLKRQISEDIQTLRPKAKRGNRFLGRKPDRARPAIFEEAERMIENGTVSNPSQAYEAIKEATPERVKLWGRSKNFADGYRRWRQKLLSGGRRNRRATDTYPSPTMSDGYVSVAEKRQARPQELMPR